MESNKLILDVKKVYKRFGGIEALRGVDLKVFKGDFIGLIGPNGSGKTTLTNVITGIYKPDSGDIIYMGRRITGAPPHVICRYGISRTFQIPQPFGDMSVYENIMIPLRFCRGRREEEISRSSSEYDVWEILEMFDLKDKAYREAGKLTLVEKRLLELARALVTNPRLIILDEVAAGLTEDEISRISGLLIKLNIEKSLSIIWIEHRIGDLLKYVKRLVVMNSGTIIADGPPAEVIKMPEVIEIYIGRAMLNI